MELFKETPIKEENDTTKYNYNLYKKNYYDFIVRFQQNSDQTETVVTDYISTREFVSKLRAVSEIKDFLIQVIKKQKELIEYNGYYLTYAMGGIEEKEFEEISSKFLNNLVQLDKTELAKKVYILIKETNLDFTKQELKNIFSCKDENIDEAVSLIKNDIRNSIV